MRKENTMEQHDSTEAPLCDACRRIPISHLALDFSEPLVGWEAFFDCPRCRRKAWTKKPPANAYAYGGGWGELRLRVLKRDGYQCQLRYADICLGKASQVDHIVQPEAGGTNALENLRAVCRRCHARRTGRQGALAKQRAAQ